MFLDSVPDVSHFCLTVSFNFFFFLLHLFIGLIYWLNFTVSFNFQVTQSLLAYFLLSHFFLLHLFIKLNFTVSFNLAYFLLSLSFNFFESVFIFWCCSIISSFLLGSFFLLHIFIELILLPHLIIQVKHCLAYFLLLIFTVSRCVTLLSQYMTIFVRYVTLLSHKVTLYKREGVWTDY